MGTFYMNNFFTKLGQQIVGEMLFWFEYWHVWLAIILVVGAVSYVVAEKRKQRDNDES